MKKAPRKASKHTSTNYEMFRTLRASEVRARWPFPRLKRAKATQKGK